MNSSKKSKILDRTHIINAIIIVLIASIVGIFYNLLLPNPLPWKYTEKEIITVADSLLFPSGQDPIDTVKANKRNIKDSITNYQSNINPNLNDKNDHSQTPITNNKSEEPQIEESQGSIKSISYSQLLKILNNPDFIIIDARRPDEFNKGHIPGAINIYALDEPDIRVPKMLNLQNNKTLIVYCDGGNCDLSHELANELINVVHYPKVFIYSGGWEEWANKQSSK